MSTLESKSRDTVISRAVTGPCQFKTTQKFTTIRLKSPMADRARRTCGGHHPMLTVMPAKNTFKHITNQLPVGIGLAVLFLMVCVMGAMSFAPSGVRAAEVEGVWSELKVDLFGDRLIRDGRNILSLDAPYRAHDAALVPVTIKLLTPRLNPKYRIKTLTLVIDQNPAPVAAVFKMAPESAISKLSTRVRVNKYTDIRAIAEMQDGTFYMVKRFVKAAGGCAAPAAKNTDIARQNLGQMKFRQFARAPSAANQSAQAEVQIMIRHMNNSGLQRDQITGYYIPAYFVDSIAIKQAGRPLMDIEGAISMSENPTVRFSFLSHGGAKLDVLATDTEGGKYKGSWNLLPSAKNGS